MSDLTRRLFIFIHIACVAVLAFGCVIAFVAQRYDAALVLVGAILGAGLVEIEKVLEDKVNQW